MNEFQRLEVLPADDLAPLIEASAQEGFAFLGRLTREWHAGAQRFNAPGELLLAAYSSANIVALGGLTPDPFSSEPALGRLRHIYVRPDNRRRGLGRHLVRALEENAEQHYHALVLRTDSRDAALFYQALGYRPLPPGGTATHRRELAALPL